ncbi:MAG: thioredoxin [Candidatus Krumholzibacteriota bacterium]|nr:thioredoxin [Candidatus Krumholzibacteriota bacterium]
MNEKTITKVSDGEFNEKVIDPGRPAVVDFWATWCQPCRRLDEIIGDVAGRYDGRVSFYKVDVNENAATASRFAVRSIPMLLFFNGGEVVDQVVGAMSREEIERKLERLLEPA